MRTFFTALLLPFSALLIAAEAPKITVSILPLQSMVQELVGSAAIVSVLIPPGASPEQFEPSPSQIRNLSRSLCHFSVGANLERVWMPRIQKQMPRLKVVDLGSPLATRLFSSSEEHSHHSSEKTHHHAKEKKEHYSHEADPHVWTDPLLLIRMAESAAEELKILFPGEAAAIDQRLIDYRERFQKLNWKIASILAPMRGRVLLVFHPAWGYFADRYGLKQVAIEQSGRAPGPRMLSATIDLARKEGATAIFVQAQMNQSVAQAIASELNIPVVEIDPLSANPEQSLLLAAEKISRHLPKRENP